MYNLLIVDDELPILDGLFNNIAWEECGFANIYKADSVSLALELAAQHRMDVIVTDISMPGMDGLAMCERIRSIWPLCRIVLLTGFRDFDYARRAVEMGVYQYLVKPVRYEDLQSVVKGALEELRQDLAQNKLLDRAKEKLCELEQLMRERCLSNWLIQGIINPETDEAEMKAVGIDISSGMYGFALILKWHTHSGNTMVFQMALIEMMKRLIPGCERMWTLQIRYDEMLVIFLSRDEAAAKALYVQCCDSLDVLQTGAQHSADCTLSIFISRLGSAAHLHDVCMALMRVKQRTPAEPGVVLLMSSEDDGEDVLNAPLLKEAVSGLRLDLFDKWLQRCMNVLSDRTADEKWRQMMLTALLAALSGDVLKRGIVFGEMQSVYMTLISPSMLAMQREEFAQKCRWVVEHYIDYIQKRQTSQRSQLVDSVKLLISEQMANGISVNYIAEQMHYSSNYLSHLIKQETGISLEDMLISMRIEKACQLLRSGMRVQEAAMSVGYDNLAHFSRLFKQKKGCSPRQYVNQG